MEATILNKDFEAIGLIDNYKSFIWTDRYDEAGDFEIVIPITDSIPDIIQKGYYLWNVKSEHVMIIETMTIETDVEEGAFLTISGESLESILKRRVVWNKKIFNIDDDGNYPNLQNGLKTMIEENLISPSMEVRTIPNFIFEVSDDPKITALTFEAQYLGEDLYTVVHNQCAENDIGFKVTLNDDNQFVFKLYAGVDRSYAQEDNPYVIFSRNYDNILNTSYVDSDANLKNITLVVGETELDADGLEVRRRQYVEGDAASSGLDRREIFTDATSLTTDDGAGGTLTAAQYQAHLKQRGIDTLMKNTSVMALDGEIDATGMFVYGEDFLVGDIVQLIDVYGHEGQAYISELVLSCEDSGTSMYPTFKAIQKGVYET